MSTITTASGLIYEEITVGAGAEAARGQHVTVHYTGWLTSGTKFDSSKDRHRFPQCRTAEESGRDPGARGKCPHHA